MPINELRLSLAPQSRRIAITRFRLFTLALYRNPHMKSFSAVLFLVALGLFLPTQSFSQSQPATIPDYILRGLDDYQNKGYEAAVNTWLSQSHLPGATSVVSRMNFFKNIEMFYGKYLKYDVVFVQETPISSRVYIRMNFEKTSCYILFTSLLMNGDWRLKDLDLDRLQKFGSNVQ